MRMNHSSIFCILACAMVAGCDVANVQPLPAEPPVEVEQENLVYRIQAKPEKDEYASGERINLVITNSGTGDIWFSSLCPHLRFRSYVFENGEWVTKEWMQHCITWGNPIVLKVGEKLDHWIETSHVGELQAIYDAYTEPGRKRLDEADRRTDWILIK